MGYSFGGYHAPRICAFEKRYAACVAFGAMHWSVYELRHQGHGVADPTRASSSTFQFRWVVGAPDNETALEWAKKFTLEGVAQKVECPFLVLHGENDRIVPLDAAQKLYSGVGSKKKDLASSPPRKAAPSTARSITASSASTIIGDWLLEEHVSISDRREQRRSAANGRTSCRRWPDRIRDCLCSRAAAHRAQRNRTYPDRPIRADRRLRAGRRDRHAGAAD